MSRNLQKKANLIFYQILGIALIFLIAFLFLIINIYPKILILGKSALGKLEMICGCKDHLSITSHPFIFALLFLTVLSILTFSTFIIVKIIKLRRATSLFIKINLQNKKRDISPKLRIVAKSLGLENKFVEIHEEKPIIFCFGLFKPKICISSGLIRKLHIFELRAVLLHERHHLFVNEPIKLFLVKIIEKILFFLPISKVLSKYYLLFSELSADEEAIVDLQNKDPLIRALYKIIKSKERLILNKNLPLSFFSTITGERISKLVDDKYNPHLRFYIPRLIISIALLFFIIISSGIFVNSSKLISSHNETNNCPSMVAEDYSAQCQMLRKEPVCKMDYNQGTHSCETNH